MRSWASELSKNSRLEVREHSSLATYEFNSEDRHGEGAVSRYRSVGGIDILSRSLIPSAFPHISDEMRMVRFSSAFSPHFFLLIGLFCEIKKYIRWTGDWAFLFLMIAHASEMFLREKPDSFCDKGDAREEMWLGQEPTVWPLSLATSERLWGAVCTRVPIPRVSDQPVVILTGFCHGMFGSPALFGSRRTLLWHLPTIWEMHLKREGWQGGLRGERDCRRKGEVGSGPQR